MAGMLPTLLGLLASSDGVSTVCRPDGCTIIFPLTRLLL